MTAGHFANIQAIVFDAVGTLIHPSPSASEVYAAVGRLHGSRLNQEEVRRRFLLAFQGEEELDHGLGFRTDEVRELERWRRVVGAVLDDVRDTERVFRELFAHFAQASAWVLTADLPPLLARCEQKGYRLAIASNYDSRLHQVVTGFPALASFEPVLASSEVGWRKPARGFFDALALRLGLEPRAIVYVGDHIEHDYQAALAAGLRSVLFDPLSLHAGETPKRASTISELIDLLLL